MEELYGILCEKDSTKLEQHEQKRKEDIWKYHVDEKMKMDLKRFILANQEDRTLTQTEKDVLDEILEHILDKINKEEQEAAEDAAYDEYSTRPRFS